MKKILFFCFVFLGHIQVSSANSFVYPLAEIAKPACRYSPWSTLEGSCKMSLPHITGADYTSLKDNKEYRRIYSVLWGATYTYGWDVGYGSHEGVDIATAQGTPVQSIGDGVILSSGWQTGWGNVVSIKHTLSDGKAIYSNYAHLSKTNVTKGATVRAGDTIGEVGNTGNSYGNHLHFQIDTTNQAHPYYYVTCGKGKDPMTIVDQGLCRDFLTANTIDPIAFLENGSITTTAAVQVLQDKSKIAPKIEKKSIKTREQILDEEIEEFFRDHTLSVNLGVSGNNIEAGRTYTARVNVTYHNKPFTGSLPAEGMTLSYDRTGVKLFPETIIAIENGVREFQITGIKPGKYGISLKIGKRIFLTTSVNVYKKSEMSMPTQGFILQNKSIVLADEKLMGVVFRTKYSSNQIDIPYNGRYVLKSVTGKAKFCNVSKRSIRQCSTSELVEELEFGYDDTYRGVLLANIIPLDYMPIGLVVVQKETGKTLIKSTTDILVTNPNGIDKTYTYFTETVSALKKRLIKPNSGYVLQDRELLGKQAKDMIRNALAYQFLKAGNDQMKKRTILMKMKNFDTYSQSVEDYKSMTREQFAGLVITGIDGSPLVTSDKKWLDEAGKYKDAITTLRVRYRFFWKDQFGERYFQSSKNITVGESMYMIEKVL
ncbi:MAG: M23 family metallopeptidase [Candidatus Gracilibacteria bacterium]|nr:M23 family metallopeptidase [Candidatus Gracilibacteria bacterium]